MAIWRTPSHLGTRAVLVVLVTAAVGFSALASIARLHKYDWSDSPRMKGQADPDAALVAAVFSLPGFASSGAACLLSRWALKRGAWRRLTVVLMWVTGSWCLGRFLQSIPYL